MFDVPAGLVSFMLPLSWNPDCVQLKVKVPE